MGKISGLIKSSNSRPRVAGCFGPPPQYFADPLILPRVRQYLEENRSNRFVDLDDIVESFRNKYREYARRKRSAFKSVLKRALECEAHSYGFRCNDSEDSDDEDEEENNNEDDDEEEEEEDEDEIDVEDDNASLVEKNHDANNHLLAMYMQKQKQGNGAFPGNGGEELINISSDEDTNNEPMNGKNFSLKPTVVTISRAPKNSKESTNSIILKNVKREADSENKNPLKRKALSQNGSSKKRRTVPVTVPSVTFSDIGGCGKILQDVSQLLLHIRHPEVYKALGVSAPRGFLLHGPPGSGKTLLAHAIAGELGISLIKVAGPEMVGSQSGESEERIRDLFEQALALAPSVLFIDEVDAITPNRQTAQREMERRIVAQLLSSLDELAKHENGEKVVVIGATNRPDALDPALRRAGRFDREVCLGIPDSKAREGILKNLFKELKLASDVSLDNIVMMTPGFVGADLKALVTEAAMAAINRLFSEIRELSKIQVSEECNIESEKNVEQTPKISTEDVTLVSTTDENVDIEVIEEVVNVKNDRIEDISIEVVETIASPKELPLLLNEPPIRPEQLDNLYITTEDFKVALKSVQPSAKREGFATVPDVTWDDIGSLKKIRQELQMAIMAPVRYPEQFEVLGLNKPTGVLLCGPPGCGKTLLAKAVANEAGINFISVKGPELLNMYVGESERAVRQCFQRARNSQPCVIFFDELDALCPKRSNLNETGASRVVNQLLTEMDGVEGRTGVFLMAATNRPDIVDPAVMRPGRLDKVLYVGLPEAIDRLDIMQALTKNGTKPVLSEDVNLEELANDSHCNGYTGADIAALIREAGVEALKEFMTDTDKKPLMVSKRHFTSAFEKIRPSVSPKDQLRYEQLRMQYAAVPYDK